MPKKAKWNELPCPACKEPCSTSATKCPQCQTVFSEEQLKQRKGAMKAGMIGCGGLIVLVGIAGAIFGDDEDAPLAGAPVQAEADIIPAGAELGPAPEPPENSFTAEQRARGDHCLGSAFPYVHALGLEVLLNLPDGEHNFRNDRTFIRGAQGGRREVVMEFTLIPNGRYGATIAALEPATCELGNIDLRFADAGVAGYPIEY